MTAARLLAFNSGVYMQGDHSPDNVKFPDSWRHSSAALGMLYHARTKYLYGCKYAIYNK